MSGIAWASVATTSSWLPAGRETTVKDALTAPPEVTVAAVALSVWSAGALRGLGATDSDRSGNGELDTASVKLLTADQSFCVLPKPRPTVKEAGTTRAATTAKTRN